MTDYFKARTSLVYSVNSDYSLPTINYSPADMTSSTVTKKLFSEVAALTTGTTVSLANFTTIQGIMVKNLDATNYVDVTWVYSAATSKARVPAGQWMFIPTAVTVASNLILTANTATCVCEVLAAGT